MAAVSRRRPRSRGPVGIVSAKRKVRARLDDDRVSHLI
jgi:hypothetical protein